MPNDTEFMHPLELYESFTPGEKLRTFLNVLEDMSTGKLYLPKSTQEQYEPELRYFGYLGNRALLPEQIQQVIDASSDFEIQDLLIPFADSPQHFPS